MKGISSKISLIVVGTFFLVIVYSAYSTFNKNTSAGIATVSVISPQDAQPVKQETEVAPELLGIDLRVNLVKFKALYADKIAECKPEKYSSEPGAESVETIKCTLNDSAWVSFTNIANADYSIWMMSRDYPLTEGAPVQFFTAVEALEQKIHHKPTQSVTVNSLGFKVSTVKEDFFHGKVRILSGMYATETAYSDVKLSSVTYMDWNLADLLDKLVADKKMEMLKQKDKNFSL